MVSALFEGIGLGLDSLLNDVVATGVPIQFIVLLVNHVPFFAAAGYVVNEKMNSTRGCGSPRRIRRAGCVLAG